MKRNLAFALFSLFGACLLQVNNLHARESLEDGILWSTKAEINEKFGKPSYLYCEEEPFRRYMIVKPEDENSLRATFLYDVTIHDFYYLKKNGNDLEYRFYYGEDLSEGQKTFRVKECTIKFLNNPIPLGKVVEFIPEFKPAFQCSKVFQERLINFNNIRLIFVTEKVNELSKKIGSLFVDPDRDIKDWSLSYYAILNDGEPENVSSNSMVKEIIIAVDGEYRIGKTANAFRTKLVKNPLQ
ncbi:hypothetical protein BIY37_01740 [Candidatus Brocadia sapporoensis]|uniref:Uncharacterized protein n=1 Tax=Candidatus Brocadia sapporoensis TaxID=392547 RepID=A0A1V6M370_9BACT|nr:hypothetical protein [Candidatus Brocadia sapporoensis]MDG6006594.1 hypothetical protein [Candidatus Brocadia sp.]OQD46756.1 hypothetical protein BIY37_01740 [Candidatus Brocadia sapporoensis]GJQ22644.1 MAG: hypothetical protein HBSAPP01_04340 [Candidatus Brocadia sapporoensis]